MANNKNYLGWSNPFETKYGKMQSLKLNVEALAQAAKEAKKVGNEDVYLSIGETKNGALAVWEDEYKNRSDQSQYQKKKEEAAQGESSGGGNDLPF